METTVLALPYHVRKTVCLRPKMQVRHKCQRFLIASVPSLVGYNE
jgi:hypothetical protein